MNTFTFNDRAAYIAAKGSSGSIYAALQGVTGVVSASTVSFIKATGETLIDAMNVFVGPEMGEIGDTLYYITTANYTGFKWLKSKAGYSYTSYGQTFWKSILIPSSYVEVGVLIFKHGNKGLIAKNTEQTISWCPAAYKNVTVSGVTTCASSTNKVGDGTICTYGSFSRLFAEEKWGDAPYRTSWPFPKSKWDAMVAKIYENPTAGASDSGTGLSNSSWSYTVTYNPNSGVGTGSFTCNGPYGELSGNPKDYHYDFDEWYKKRVLLQYPTDAPCAGDFEGRASTKSIVKWANSVSLTTSNCAAKYCNDSVAATGVPGYTAGNWWLPSTGEVLNVGRCHKQLKKKGTQLLDLYRSIWTSTQYSEEYAWFLESTGMIAWWGKENTHKVIAVSAFQF